jgi:cyclic pyranopterin phosphate synthase
MGMIDIGNKPIMKREAEAIGKIALTPLSIERIKKGQIRKGDPLAVADIAAISAAKQTHLLIPHCHQLALNLVKVDFDIKDESIIEARCFVSACARTGVEMEALVGVTAALNTIWDMVKYLEKNEEGQYPNTKIIDIKIIKKTKEFI